MGNGAWEGSGIKAYLASWLTAGEEGRVYAGEMPHKLAIFDSKIVLMPLIRPGEPTKTVVIRHPQLAQSLGLAFEFLWQQSKPLVIEDQKKSSSKAAKTSDKTAPELNPQNIWTNRDVHRPPRPRKKLNR